MAGKTAGHEKNLFRLLCGSLYFSYSSSVFTRTAFTSVRYK